MIGPSSIETSGNDRSVQGITESQIGGGIGREFGTAREPAGPFRLNLGLTVKLHGIDLRKEGLAQGEEEKCRKGCLNWTLTEQKGEKLPSLIGPKDF